MAIGLAPVGGAACASQFNATIVPVTAPTAPGVAPPSGKARPSGHDAFSIVAMPAIEAEPGNRTSHPAYDLRIADAYQSNRLAPIKSSVRARGTGMKDAYLHGHSGARLSVGSSYHMRYRATDTGPGAAAGRGALMRLPVGSVNLRDGYESYAPVAMAGYDALIGDRVKIGVEGGMMVGRSTAMYADETMPNIRDSSHGARNPVADVMMSYAF